MPLAADSICRISSPCCGPQSRPASDSVLYSSPRPCTFPADKLSDRRRRAFNAPAHRRALAACAWPSGCLCCWRRRPPRCADHAGRTMGLSVQRSPPTTRTGRPVPRARGEHELTPMARALVADLEARPPTTTSRTLPATRPITRGTRAKQQMSSQTSRSSTRRSQSGSDRRTRARIGSWRLLRKGHGRQEKDHGRQGQGHGRQARASTPTPAEPGRAAH